MNAPDAAGPPRYVDHIGIVVLDADAAASRFAGRFGLAVVHDEIVDDVGVRLVYLAGSDRSSPTTIQLVEPLRPGTIKDYLNQHGEGVHHVCLAVDDLDAALSSLSGERQTGIFSGGRERRACFLGEQPCGTLIELVEVDPAPQDRALLGGEAR